MWATLTRCTAAGLDRRSGPPGLRLTLRVVDGAALVESAQVALAEGDVVGAVARLREAVAVRPNPSAREQLAGLLFFEDDLVSARQELELACRGARRRIPGRPAFVGLREPGGRPGMGLACAPATRVRGALRRAGLCRAGGHRVRNPRRRTAGAGDTVRLGAGGRVR